MAGAFDRSPGATGTHPAQSAGLQAVVICPEAIANPLRNVGGITLLERILRQLSALQSVESIVVLKLRELSIPPSSARVRKPVTYLDVRGSNAWEMMRDARAQLPERFIAVAGDLLIDERLLAWLAVQTSDVMLSLR